MRKCIKSPTADTIETSDSPPRSYQRPCGPCRPGRTPRAKDVGHPPALFAFFFWWMLKHSRRPVIRVPDTLASDLQTVSSRTSADGINDGRNIWALDKICHRGSRKRCSRGISRTSASLSWEEFESSSDRYAEDVAANLE